MRDFLLLGIWWELICQGDAFERKQENHESQIEESVSRDRPRTGRWDSVSLGRRPTIRSVEDTRV